MRSPRALAIGLVLLAIAFMSAMDAAAKTANAALPVLFVVILGPAIINIQDTMKGTGGG